jgi:hypothetical protein
MRNFPRRLLHVIQRFALALVGAATGLFVGIQTGSTIPALTNPTFLLVMTIIGAIGFYLGIDTPTHRYLGISINLPGDTFDGRVGAAELLTTMGTLLAALASFISVAMIVFVVNSSQLFAGALLAVWALGAFMQVASGAMARLRR